MLGIPPEMIQFIITGKLDEIITGNVPEQVKIKERTADKIVLVPADKDLFPGLTVNRLSISITWKGIEIILINE